MYESVTLPLWLFVLLLVFAAWAAVGSLFIPGVRWFLRRRIDRMVEEINTRLRLKIQPFKLSKRKALIDRLIHDPEVIEAAEAHAKENGLRREDVMVQAGHYAREIVPSFNAYVYFRVGFWLARAVANLLYRVRLGYADDAGLARVASNTSVVFVMNHRSNMDYIIVAYLAATRAALSYAVGEWAHIWPLHTLIRSMGAYFIRRGSGDPLYRRVLARYVAMATAGGVVQALYPEGRLTRDGRLQEFRLGLLSYMVSAFDPDGERDLVFVPVGVNYDRVLEDRSLVRRLDPEAAKRSALFVMRTTAAFLLHNIGLALRRRWYRYGYAGVNFGPPVSMKSYTARRGVDFRRLTKEERFAEVERLGKELRSAVGRVIPVLPVSLVATVFLRAGGRRLSELELKAAVFELMRDLEAAGAHVYIPRRDQEYAVTVGLRMLALRHFVEERDGLYAAGKEDAVMLRYYANAIAHFLEPGGDERETV